MRVPAVKFNWSKPLVVSFTPIYGVLNRQIALVKSIKCDAGFAKLFKTYKYSTVVVHNSMVL